MGAAAGGGPGRSGWPRDSGFTLVELLIVMSIIGVLSAVAIPLFAAQQRRSVDASMQVDLRRVASQLETYFADNSVYPLSLTVSGSTATIAPGFTATISSGTTMTMTSPARAGSSLTYCLVASRVAGASSGSQNWAWISDKDGLQPAGTAGCS